ncbi:serine endoprotease DegS-like [Lolium rigidum]|uniref:serine endoprotease DegS-like n=1 Tax=Lolium rigidum TaxID=89674 RepID=UPI001F5DB58C|nr:serine endoprotease DegS-like [Lolium rigidum]
MRSAAGDEPGSGGTTALPIGEESSARLTRSRARLLAGEKTEPKEAAQSVGDSRGKRRKVEGVSVGKSRAAEGGKRMLTAEEVALAARPLPPEEPPYPKSGDHADVVAWINAKDALYNKDNLGEEGSLFNILMLGRGKVRVKKSVASAASMESMDGRDMIADVARSVVNPLIVPVSLFPDGKVLYTTGIIIEYDEIGKCAKILSSSSFMCTKEGKLRHPDQKVLVHLSKDTVVEARVIFLNGHYGISLLDISTLFTLVPASLGSGPCYGQNVSVLDREVDHALVVSRGSILCLEYPSFQRNHYMFTSYFSHLICTGGPVINNSGEVIGLVVKHIPQAAIVSASIVRKCIQMWNQFGRIAHPIHHLKLTTVRMLDMVYRDELWSRHNIRSGFIVAEVSPNSTAEKIGIRRGDVIELIDLDHLSTVVEVVMTQLQNNSKTAGRKMPPIVSRSWCA